MVSRGASLFIGYKFCAPLALAVDRYFLHAGLFNAKASRCIYPAQAFKAVNVIA